MVRRVVMAAELEHEEDLTPSNAMSDVSPEIENSLENGWIGDDSRLLSLEDVDRGEQVSLRRISTEASE